MVKGMNVRGKQDIKQRT